MDRCSPLPDDLAACQALIRQQAQQLDALAQQLDAQARQLDAHLHTIESHALTIEELERQKLELKRQHEELQLAYNELLRRAFEPRRERYLEDPHQLKLDFAG
jgi:chromosome segregation ATPase